ITPPAPEDVRTVVAAAQDHDPVLACWLQVAVATGARRGEVCALRWGDLDAATVRIERPVRALRLLRARAALHHRRHRAKTMAARTRDPPLGRLRAKLGLPRARIHDLRHFVASRTSTTLDIYWAWVPARDRDAAHHLDALLAENPCQ